MFSMHFLQSSPAIYQTTFEKLPQAPAEQSEGPSTYQKEFHFFNLAPSESNIPVSSYQSATPQVIIEGSEESHILSKTTPFPTGVQMHEWEIPQDTNMQPKKL
jgi:hypothetical protein